MKWTAFKYKNQYYFQQEIILKAMSYTQKCISNSFKATTTYMPILLHYIIKTQHTEQIVK
jgi:hypothetical protein